MIYAINYFAPGPTGAGEIYRKTRDYNTKTAYEIGGVDKVIEYTPEMISDFISKHKDIFNIEKGAGLWLWKPYIALKTLEDIGDGDYMFYADAGSFYIDKVQKLINVMERDKIDIMLFELPLLARQFTKKETFVLMDYHNYEHNQILATCFLMKKTAKSLKFTEEWLNYCSDLRILSPDHFCPEIKEFEDYIDHREDQSVLDIVARKWNLPVYREPSEGGLFPWNYATKNYTYVKQVYKNSTYPVIILNNRKINAIKYERKYKESIFLTKIGLKNEFFYFANWKIRHFVKVVLLGLGLKSLYNKLK